MLRCVSLALLSFATPSLAGSWVDVGERHRAAVLRLFEVGKQMQDKKATPEKMVQLAAEMSNFYAPVITCQQLMGTAVEVNLQDVPATKCFEAGAIRWPGVIMMNFDVREVGIAPQSGGKTVLATMTFDMAGVGPDGVVRSSTARKGAHAFTSFHFDDNGKIVKYHSEWQASMTEHIIAQMQHVGNNIGLLQLSSASAAFAFVAIFAVGFLSGGLVLVLRKAWLKPAEPALLLGYAPA